MDGRYDGPTDGSVEAFKIAIEFKKIGETKTDNKTERQTERQTKTDRQAKCYNSVTKR